jgi:hypothetical protein
VLPKVVVELSILQVSKLYFTGHPCDLKECFSHWYFRYTIYRRNITTAFFAKHPVTEVIQIYSYIYLYMITVVLFVYLVCLKRHEIISILILVQLATVIKRKHANFLEIPLIPRRQIVDHVNLNQTNTTG